MYLIHERITDLKSAIILLSTPFTFWSAPQLCLNLMVLTNNTFYIYTTGNIFIFKLSMYNITSAKFINT